MPSLPSSLDELARRLRDKSRKLTGPRQSILNLLRQEEHLLSSKEICAKLPPGNCDLATVYRSLHMLEEMQMVRRFDFGDGIARYALQRGESSGASLICTQCHRALSIETGPIAELEAQVTRQHGFRNVTHKLEFFGLCPRCGQGR